MALLAIAAATGDPPSIHAVEALTTLKQLSGSESDLVELARVGDHAFFAVNTTGGGGGCGSACDLWQSDGTPTGTVPVARDLAYVEQLTDVGGTLFFVSQRLAGTALWKSDGTSRGTAQVADLGPASIASLTDARGTLYFGTGAGLWKSNGTEDGTVLVSTVVPGTITSASDGTVFFTTLTAIWRSDGTSAGTVKIFESAGSRLGPVVEGHGALFFEVFSPDQHQWALWKSDGTPAGTTVVSEHPVPDPGPTPGASSPGDLIRAGDLIFFQAFDGAPQWTLWRSDGTPRGTIPLTPLPERPACRSLARPPHPPTLVCSGRPTGTDVDGRLFFNPTGSDLWQSDGTPAGTRLVAAPPGLYSYPFVNVHGTLFFGLFDGGSGTTLWKSDGTMLGTQPVVAVPGLFDRPTPLRGSLLFLSPRATGTVLLALPVPCGDDALSPLEKTVCEVRELPAALVCENGQRPLGIRARRLDMVEHLIRRADTAKPRRGGRLRHRASKTLQGLEKPIPKLLRGHRISEPCAAALRYRLAYRRALIADLRRP